jgi:hypothetical protein
VINDNIKLAMRFGAVLDPRRDLQLVVGAAFWRLSVGNYLENGKLGASARGIVVKGNNY